MTAIIRSAEEIEEAGMRAQAVSFKAEDEGDTDEAADAIYRFWQWLTGNSDADPTVEMAEELEEE